MSQKEHTYKQGELRKVVLAALGVSLVLGTSIVFPSFPIVLGSLLKIIEELKQKKIPERKIKRVLKNLEKRNIIALERIKDTVYVHIQDKENISILKYSLKKILKLKESEKKWRGKWFLVVFDVPEVERNKRNYLRHFLREIGFYQYQQSVYVFPYECEKEIQLVKKIVEGGKYISYIVAERIEKETQAKIFFSLYHSKDGRTGMVI